MPLPALTPLPGNTQVSAASDWKLAVVVASTANLTLSGEQTVDGVSLVDGQRILVKDQTDASQNGIYIVRISAWARTADADSTNEITSGVVVAVTEGTANAGTVWLLTTADPIVVGTTNLTFTQIGDVSSSGGLLASNNLSDVDDAATSRDNLGLELGSDVQAYDIDLAAIAGLATTGLLTRTGAGTALTRAVTGTSGRVDVINGDGVSGAPTIDVLGALLALGGLTPAADRLGYFDGASSAALATFTSLGREFAKSVAQTFSNANVTVNSNTRVLIQTGTMSASRTATLPLANSVAAGTTILVIDFSGSVTSVNTIAFAATAPDSITSTPIAYAYGTMVFVSDGTSKWSIDGSILRANHLGSVVQQYDADLAALGGVTSAADKVPYFTGSATASVADFTAFGREFAKSATQTAADTNLTINAATRVAILTSATATRTFTLPAANAVTAGTPLWVLDGSGSLTSSINLTIARAGSDTINGATSVSIQAAYGSCVLISDGTSKWFTPAAAAASQTLSSPTVNNGQHNNGKFAASTEDRTDHGTTSGTVTLDCSTTNVKKVTANGNVTIAFSNVPSSGNVFSLTLIFIQDATGGRTLTFPAAVVWNGGTVPSVSTTANKKTIYEMFTEDGGTTWYAGQVGKDWA